MVAHTVIPILWGQKKQVDQEFKASKHESTLGYIKFCFQKNKLSTHIKGIKEISLGSF